MTHFLTGKLIDLITKKMLSGFTVEAWDHDVKHHDLLGVATSSLDGSFKIAFDKSAFKDHPIDKLPDLYFKIYKGKHLVLNTQKKIIKNYDINEDKTFVLKVAPLEKAHEITKKELNKPVAELIKGTGENASFFKELLNEELKQKVLAQLPDKSPVVKKLFEETTFDFTTSSASTIKGLVEEKVEQFKNETPGLEEVVADIGAQFEEGESIQSALDLDQPLINNPVLKSTADWAKTQLIAKAAGIKKGESEKVTFLLTNEVESKEKGLQEAVATKLVTQEKANALRVGMAMDVISKSDMGLSEKVASMSKITKASSAQKPLKGMLKLEDKEWDDIAESSKVWRKEYSSKKTFKEALKKQVTAAYPYDALIHDLTGNEKRAIKKDITDAKKILTQDRLDALGQRKGEEYDAVTDKKGKKSELEAYNRLSKLTNRYKYLGAKDLLQDPKKSVAEKERLLSAKVDDLAKFYENNPDLDIRKADLVTGKSEANNHNSGSIKWDGIAPENQKPIKDQLLAYQRVFRVADRPEDALSLVEAGYETVATITEVPVNVLSEQTGIDPGTSQTIMQNAMVQRVALDMASTNMLEIEIDYPSVNVLEVFVGEVLFIPEELKTLEGYESLFGPQKFCTCDHCSSIYSPAAYFVDLMVFIRRNISLAVYYGDADNPGRLKNRRPDLWKIALNCENTNKPVPYLTIINTILEKYIKAQKDQEPYTILASANQSLLQPFSLATQQAYHLLTLKGSNLYEVASILGQDNHILIKSRFKLSSEEYARIIINAGTTTEVKKRYGSPSSLGKIDVQQVLKHLMLEREQLDQLLTLPFLNEEGTLKVTIERLASDGINQYTEYLLGGSKNNLDLVHRFVRLLRKTSWSIQELGYVLYAHKRAKNANNSIITAEAIEVIGLLDTIKEKEEVGLEALVTFLGYIPDFSVKEGDLSLFDRLFNGYELLEDWEPDNLPTVKHYFFDINRKGNDPVVKSDDYYRTLNALGVTESQFQQLIAHLREEIALSTEGEFSLAHFQSLYQHALLARILNVDVDLLFFLISLSGISNSNTLSSFEEVTTFLAFVDKLHVSHNKLALLTPTAFQVNIAVSQALVGSYLMELDKHIVFSQKDFNRELELGEKAEPFLKSLAEQGIIKSTYSKNFLVAKKVNATTIEALLKESKIGSGKKVAIKTDQALKFFSKYHLSKFFKGALANTLSMPHAAINTIITTHIGNTNPLINKLLKIWTLQEEKAKAFEFKLDHTGYKDVVHEVHQLMVEIAGFSERILKPVLKPIPLAALKEKNMLSTEHLAFLTVFLETGYVDASNFKWIDHYLYLTSKVEEASLGQLHTLIHALEADGQINQQINLQLSEVFNKEIQLVQSVSNDTAINGTSLEQLSQAVQRIIYCELLGIDGTTLSGLVAFSEQEVEDAVKALEAGLKSTYDASEWEEVKEGMNDKVNALKNEALVDYLLTDEAFNFEDHNDLYEYFLVDTQMGSCGRVSYIKSALLSLQLYVQRCLTGQEKRLFTQGDWHNLNHYEINMEWEWRKNYRVWEANRKVFLYPENYIEPSLRDNKSPEFKELEDEMLQIDMNKEAIEEVYKNYFERIDQLSKLKITGNYYDNKTDTLYLLGKNSDEPPVYYIRKIIGGNDYYPWEAIDTPIDAEKASPIIFRDKLFIVWHEVNITQETSFSNNQASSTSKMKSFIKYTYLKHDGTWESIQKLNELPDNSILNPQPRGIDTKLFLRADDENIYFSYIKYKSGTSISMSYEYYIDFYDKTYHRSGGDDAPLETKKILSIIDEEFDRNHIRVIDTINRDSLNYGASLLFSESGDKATQKFKNHDKTYAIDIVHKRFGDSIVKDGAQYFWAQNTSNFDYSNLSALWQAVMAILGPTFDFKRLNTETISSLDKLLHNSGIEGLLTPEAQKTKESVPSFDLSDPSRILFDEVFERIELDFKGAFGNYYREIFFQIPFLIANHLNSVGKYEEAQHWYHYIFNPLASNDDGEGNKSWWKYLEFRSAPIQSLEEILTDEEAIEKYKKDPFNPHAIARMRVNAYQKAIFMKYIDNLLDWGDTLFTRDTFESNNEALMLYMLAYDILGKRPQKLGNCNDIDPNLKAFRENLTYTDVVNFYEERSEFMHVLENYALAVLVNFVRTGEVYGNPNYNNPGLNLLFCLPHNEKLLKYWDRVEDRIYKLRNCMNISGVVRQLPMFQPPIDPMLLVRAKAAGLSIEEALYGAGNVVNYRFLPLLEKAKYYTQQIQGYGARILAALEKKDSQELQLLMTSQDINIKQLLKDIKTKQIEDAEEQISIIQENIEVVNNRMTYYSALLNEGEIETERNEKKSTKKARDLHEKEIRNSIIASINYLIPQIGSPMVFTFGGRELGGSFQAIARHFASKALIKRNSAERLSTKSRDIRRDQQWEY